MRAGNEINEYIEEREVDVLEGRGRVYLVSGE